MIEKKSPATAPAAPTVPRRIQIEPTNRCNFKCGYCRRTHWARPDGEMSLDRYMTLLDRLPAAPRIHLQGVGEPLLNKDLPEMIRRTRLRGRRVGTNTNASLLNLKASTRLLDAGINRINLSLDTIDPDEFARIRPGSTIARVLANIATLAEVRYKGNYADTELALAVVAEQSTIGDLPRVVELAANLGLDEVYVQNLNSSFLPDDYVGSQQLGADGHAGYREVTRLTEELAAKLSIRFLAPTLGNLDLESRCRWPFHGCNITWDGFVSPCCLQPDPDVLHFGNVFDMDFEQIWHGPAYERFRADVRADRASICAECPDRYGQMWHPLAAPL